MAYPEPFLGTNATITLADGTQMAITNLREILLPVTDGSGATWKERLGIEFDMRGNLDQRFRNPFTYGNFYQTLLKQYPALAEFGVETSKDIDLNQWFVIADWIQDQGGEALAVLIRDLFGSEPVELLR